MRSLEANELLPLEKSLTERSTNFLGILNCNKCKFPEGRLKSLLSTVKMFSFCVIEFENYDFLKQRETLQVRKKYKKICRWVINIFGLGNYVG